MKKKTLACLTVMGLIAFFCSADLRAKPVETKDEPEKCGGYHDGNYHLKCKNEKTAKKGYVDRDHKWKNPFKGFTKGNESGKSKKQNSMPSDSPH